MLWKDSSATENPFSESSTESLKYFALKKVKLGSLSEKERENALNEVRILASIDSPYIISYKESFIDQASDSLW